MTDDGQAPGRRLRFFLIGLLGMLAVLGLCLGLFFWLELGESVVEGP